MPEYCTCGAELPPDARFCHKCGKPQREEPVFVVEEPVMPQPEAPPVVFQTAPPEIGFHNTLALRVGMLSGSLAFLASSMPFHPAIRLLFLAGAGAFAVYLYGRRSGYPLEIRSGIKMGWIAGLFCFVIFTVLFAISFAALAFMMRDGGMTAYLHEQLTAMGMNQDSIRQALQVFESPVQIVGMLAWLFLTSTFLPALGGGLSARFLQKR